MHALASSVASSHPALASSRARFTRSNARAAARVVRVVASDAKSSSSDDARTTPAIVASARAASFAAVAALASPPSAHAMEGIMSVFNGQPGLLGAACVAVCWGIPQTLGMGILAKKEEKGREILREWGVEEADVEKGNWGRIQARIKEEAIRRGVERPKI
ncbi:uncharacterized protein MICPUCDRAFT_60106 [Micromonas pusilla CCMP1545]|jgi:hypothetical protein|uniref:Predicted protein n=1 Tax=Micromonas pusilla (strain CCMP1545) TaxID=564608 RepID=C1MXC7_MICPC|nr:uncharacterized protein MICPUCDRAFT_60106 [Micromonas pusilla CCMP1545]EEH55439.1 predicted protein [Micromonas pusilla CCMP1545]|eukprot:XP_003060670.1 predicted protein [Micromonas pusilla CCMP1545]